MVGCNVTRTAAPLCLVSNTVLEHSTFPHSPGAASQKRLAKVGFKIGFNKRPLHRICRRYERQADCGVNGTRLDAGFRNQQVAGSIPAGGSSFSITSTPCHERVRFKWVQFAGVSEPLSFFFSS
jgi:hypothetical protein